MASADWFEKLTGFVERDYASTQEQLVVEGDQLVSTANGKRYGIGNLALEPLSELRRRIKVPDGERTTVQCIAADVGQLHAQPEYSGALFQVASQFNLLEMIGPDVTPEDGVTRYAYDHTQGPTCAIVAGAATIYRNYLVPVGGHVGQTLDRQVDGLAEVGAALAADLGRPVTELWSEHAGLDVRLVSYGRGSYAIHRRQLELTPHQCPWRTTSSKGRRFGLWIGLSGRSAGYPTPIR